MTKIPLRGTDACKKCHDARVIGCIERMNGNEIVIRVTCPQCGNITWIERGKNE